MTNLSKLQQKRGVNALNVFIKVQQTCPFRHLHEHRVCVASPRQGRVLHPDYSAGVGKVPSVLLLALILITAGAVIGSRSAFRLTV